MRSSAFSGAFMDEAEKLWHAERRSQTPNHLSAMTYLSIATSISGKDELGTSLAAACLELAQKMSLLGVRPTAQPISTFHGLPPDKMKRLAFAAWGTYAWLT